MSYWLVLAWVGVFLLAYAGVYLIRCYALKHLLDIPNQRSSHNLPTPRGGGLAIVVVFFVAVFWGYVNNLIQLDFVLALLAGIPVAVIGFMDDHRPVGIRIRLLIHLSSAIVASLLLAGLPAIPVMQATIDLGVWGYAIAVLALVWWLNLFNFMDGIDGIAGSQAVFMALALAVFTGFKVDGQGFLSLALGVTTLGFLIWNWPPAKIFMGDVGSGFLGFALGVLMLAAGHAKPAMLYAGLILSGLFVTDASVTLLRRYCSGQTWYEAHCCHAYQHAARRYGHIKVVRAVWLINLTWLLPWAWICLLQPEYAWLVLMAAYIPLIVLVLKFNAGKG
ncbi:MAG: glycosyl transferase [Methylobacter sp.]|nr:MAG: glycosyl transferase [Methylobacter sp.]PPD24359.1 MAG: glycosyl transferase [Methylobacter sp.]